MQLLTQHRMIKAFLLVLILALPAWGDGFSDYFSKAQNGEITVSELVDFIIEKAIESPSAGPELNRYKYKIPSLSETAAPMLITKIHKLLLENKIEQAWAVKSIADILVPTTWPEGMRISQVFGVITGLETVRQQQNIGALASLKLSNLDKEDLEVSEKIIKLFAQEVIDQATLEQDRFGALRKLAELYATFPDLPVKVKATEILSALAEEQNLNRSSWSFDNPVVQQFISDIFPENKTTLVKLYTWRILDSLQEDNQNRAAIYYNLLSAQLDDSEKNKLNKEVLAFGLRQGLGSFVVARVNELKSAGQLSFEDKVKLALRGYYGWLVLVIPVLMFFALAFAISRKKPSGKKYTPRAPSRDDEYTLLLKKLDLAENASEGQIKKAFRQLVKEHHPDAHGADGVVLNPDGKVDQKFEELRKTYDRIMEIRQSWFGAR